MEIRKHLSIDQTAPRLRDYVLSPLEFELLLRSSGKMRFEDVAEEMYSAFGARFDDKDGFTAFIMDVFQRFDAQYFTVFCAI